MSFILLAFLLLSHLLSSPNLAEIQERGHKPHPLMKNGVKELTDAF